MADIPDYTPTVPGERAERIRQWHESAYQAAKMEGRVTRTFTYLGRTIAVPAEVMPITPVSHLLGEAVLAEVRPTDRVLDMGTGSGVNAVLAAGTSTSVLAVDINPHALAATRANAQGNGVADRIEVRHSDVFSTDVDGRAGHADRFLALHAATVWARSTVLSKVVWARSTVLSKVATLAQFCDFLLLRYQGDIHARTDYVVIQPIDEYDRPGKAEHGEARIPRRIDEVQVLFDGWRHACRRYASTWQPPAITSPPGCGAGPVYGSTRR